LRDITLRALDVLHAADLILCEDTRVSRTLLETYGIKGKTISCHEHNQRERLPAIVAAITAGQVVALISDAGMPLISDPGAPLVEELRQLKLPVTVIPGANAALSALSLSGLPGERFLFAGFLPAKSGERRAALAELAVVPASLIFYESPNRLIDFLADAATLLGGRNAAVARELTKHYEEVQTGTLSELLAHFNATPPRGEIVVVISPPAPQANWDEAQIDAALTDLLSSTSTRDASAQVSARSGWGKREVYARALALTQKERRS
jgi:16S rRNA (cytidine1402-2'-O)-methyltransferase